MSNGTSHIDDHPRQSTPDTIMIKLQSDAHGRYGFNVKVRTNNFQEMTMI